jgi:hypothetical protein
MLMDFVKRKSGRVLNCRIILIPRGEEAIPSLLLFLALPVKFPENFSICRLERFFKA